MLEMASITTKDFTKMLETLFKTLWKYWKNAGAPMLLSTSNT